MTTQSSSENSQHLYRIDKFKVPRPAHAEFMERVRDTHSFLRTLRGFVRDAIFEQSVNSDLFHVISLVEWQNAEVIESAKAAVAARFEADGFNPQEVRHRLGIEADIGTYVQAPAL
jgi:heme-degrading monooxygenase HmoA